ncbi:hypothetical protein GCM10009737_25610 [Nocardioides lentus]|uniref:DUF4064 domain-containing protein n=1 Tax=Nocardioides lentus TaxID=338077 RepID=A0ABP5AVI0_9ACTN
MSATTDQRPTQATLGGWLVISGSVFLVMSLFTTVSTLRSLETRRSIEEVLSTPPGSDLGLGVADVTSILHALALVAGGCAAAMAVLGVYALRRQKQARLALSVLAVPLVLAGVATGGILASLVAVAVVMLWLQPSRDWFDGRSRPAPEPARPAPGQGAGPTPGRGPGAGPGSSSGPPPGTFGGPPPGDAGGDRPTEGSGSDLPRPWGRPVAADEGSAARPWTGYGGSATATMPRDPGPAWGPGGLEPVRGRRPGAVLLACLSTWVLSGLVGALMIGGIYEVLVDPDPLLDQVRAQQPGALEQSGLTESALVTTTVALCGVLAVWALTAAVLASFAFRGSRGARVALLVSAGVTAALGLLGGLLAPLLLPIALGAGITVVGLLRPEARAWYAARPGR